MQGPSGDRWQAGDEANIGEVLIKPEPVREPTPAQEEAAEHAPVINSPDLAPSHKHRDRFGSAITMPTTVTAVWSTVLCHAASLAHPAF